MTLRKRDATMPNENPKRTCTEQDVSLPLKLYPEAIQQDPKRLARMRILGDTVARFNAMSTDETEAIRNRGMSERPKLLDVEAKSALRILVVERDTLDLAKEVFETLGIAPLVLNMANESAPGGGYRSGSAAQEENLFRRSDLHFCFKPGDILPDYADPSRVRYSREMTHLISGLYDKVYISETPRICIRGSEKFGDPTLGYRLYDDGEAFPLYEMRSAAFIVGNSPESEEEEARRRIRAQLNSARKAGHRVLVLSAFGCGAFGGTPEIVAEVYCEELKLHEDFFSLVAFGIFYAGWGENNYDVFRAVFQNNFDDDTLRTGDTDFMKNEYRRSR